MLELKNIKKVYSTGAETVNALKGIDLQFRANEFVAILGPSGCGKTTMLNIIGGLDKYTSGDLVINGVSTKKYKDRDWDSYRNHTIGFVFQSYNLIPHQTVLSNVELALTISGISSKKRRQMALDALEQVGLKDQANKKPNQMSGGQMQRVAIARALVNNPKILLADEPTGALDTKTSVQVMDLLKEVAKDRLVIMVTHNPELAEQYANRIVRIKDGTIVDDSNPYYSENEMPAVHKNFGKSSMSLLTSFGLSLNNLMTKKGRTILTAFAGSIGIIGIALILSLSTGFQKYIDQVQEDTMTSNPLTIYSETADVFSAILTMHNDNLNAEKKENTLIEQQFIQSMMNSIAKNDLKSFKKYLETHEEEYIDGIDMIKYTYSINPTIYTIDSVNRYAKINPGSAMSSMAGGYGSMMAMTGGSSNPFSEIRDYEKFKSNYELLAGEWPDNYTEMVAVVADPHQISDLLLYSLGFHDTKELRTIIQKVMAGENVVTKEKPLEITYDDLMNLDLRLVNPSDLYKYNSEYNTYEYMADDEAYLKNVYDHSEVLKITGIAYRPDSDNSSMSAGIFYLPELTYHVIDVARESEIVKKQLANKYMDVFSGRRFDDEEEKEGLNFDDMISIDEGLLSEAFKVNIDPTKFSGLNNLGNIDLGGMDEDEMADIIMHSSEAVAESIEEVTAGMVSAITAIDTQVSKTMIDQYIAAFTVSLPDPSAQLPSTPDPTDPTPSGPEAEPEEGENPEEGTPPEGGDPETPGTPETPEVPMIDYVVINANGQNMPAIYKQQAFSQQMFNMIAASMGDTIKLSPVNLKKVCEEAFDIYMASLTPNEMGMVRKDELPDPTDAINQAIKNNEAIIFQEAYNLASEYTALMIAAGMGQTVGEIMTPVMTGLTESLSGLSALSELGEVFSGGNIMSIDTDKFARAFKFDMDEDELSRLMESMMTRDSASYSGNLLRLGYQDVEDPTSISFYFKDFASKNAFVEWLDAYIENADQEQKLHYSDLTGLLLGSVEKIINAVTYVLIAFVSISLIVSSIMIGVITLISVQERTKEIGILRAIGASKRNVSSIFNAETLLIGLFSGLIGVGVTYALCIPINIIIHKLTDIAELSAQLPIAFALTLVAISVVLTLISGLIPSRSAAKKDPVVALRTE